MKLAWDASPDRKVSGYIIHYGLKPGRYTQSVRVKGRLTTRAVIGNLEKGKTYYFVITAFDAKGRQSPPSAEITTNPAAQPGRLPAGSSYRNAPYRPHAGPRSSLRNRRRAGGRAAYRRRPQRNRRNRSVMGPDGKLAPRPVRTDSEGKIVPTRQP